MLKKIGLDVLTVVGCYVILVVIATVTVATGYLIGTFLSKFLI